jgi:hypothetical protein
MQLSDWPTRENRASSFRTTTNGRTGLMIFDMARASSDVAASHWDCGYAGDIWLERWVAIVVQGGDRVRERHLVTAEVLELISDIGQARLPLARSHARCAAGPQSRLR